MGVRAREFSRAAGVVLHDLGRFDWSKFDPVTGVRSAVFVMVPLVVGAATGYLVQGLFAVVGANFITNTEGSAPNPTRLRILAIACLLEPAALAFGTMCATTGALEIPLVGLVVLGLLMVRTQRSWAQVGLISAVAFVAGAGLPGASVSGAELRFWSAALGDFWILLGLGLQRFLLPQAGSDGQVDVDGQGETGARHLHPFLAEISFGSEVFRQALVTGIACSVGLAIGLALGLPRDIWILITIVIAVRPGVGPTIESTTVLVTGTGLGAVLAAAVTLGTSDLSALTVLLLVFAFGMYSSRLVSQAMFQAFVTPFLIVLLNIIYPGNWVFALIRILDVSVGGLVAIGAVYVLSLDLYGRGTGGAEGPPAGSS